MKLFENRIGWIIDLIFCLGFMPLIIFLGPTYYWLAVYPTFAYVSIVWLYVVYFAIRFSGMPRMLMGQKYGLILLVLVIVLLGNYLLSQYPLPKVTFNTTALTDLYNDIRHSSQTMGVWLMFSIVLGYSLSMSFIMELYNQMILKKEMEIQKNNAELAMFKAQINPHFLFNTLNSLYSLLIGTSEKAENAFIKFIDLVKYTYTSVDNETVTVKDEIVYMSNYIELQMLRLNEHTLVKWSYDVDDDSAQLPPMIMITFLENVFKYGVSSHRDCMILIHLSLKNGLLMLTTENEIVKHSDEFRTDAPVGIENCKARLNTLFSDKYELSVSDTDGKYKVNLKIRLK